MIASCYDEYGFAKLDIFTANEMAKKKSIELAAATKPRWRNYCQESLV
jgi:hypothetical protein